MGRRTSSSGGSSRRLSADQQPAGALSRRMSADTHGPLRRMSASRLAAEKLFDILKTTEGTVKKSHFLRSLHEKGILSDDPRILGVLKCLEGMHGDTLQKDVFSLIMSQGKKIKRELL